VTRTQAPQLCRGYTRICVVTHSASRPGALRQSEHRVQHDWGVGILLNRVGLRRCQRSNLRSHRSSTRCGPAVADLRIILVGRAGLEPTTPCVSCKCATNCANGPCGTTIPPGPWPADLRRRRITLCRTDHTAFLRLTPDWTEGAGGRRVMGSPDRWLPSHRTRDVAPTRPVALPEARRDVSQRGGRPRWRC
jgi:hypothetical protein